MLSINRTFILYLKDIKTYWFVFYLQSNTALSLQQETRLKQMGATVRNASSYSQRLKLNAERESLAKNVIEKMSIEQLSDRSLSKKKIRKQTRKNRNILYIKDEECREWNRGEEQKKLSLSTLYILLYNLPLQHCPHVGSLFPPRVSKIWSPGLTTPLHLCIFTIYYCHITRFLEKGFPEASKLD